MKISNSVDTTGSLERSALDPARTRPASGGAVASDTIRISDLSNQLASMENQFAAEVAFDSTRVEAIKAAMRDGQFSVNPDAVADKLLESVRELLRKPS